MKMPAFKFRKPKPAGKFILWMAALVTVLAVFVPFTPRMPGVGGDPSWEFGLNQAVAQGLIFGKEFVFTFGPYEWYETK